MIMRKWKKCLQVKELDDQELSKKMLGKKLAPGTGVNISGNNEQDFQNNNLLEMGVDGRVVNTEREANNYKYQDGNRVEMERFHYANQAA
jgi:hypothetical protein